ncbi:putative ribonuclease H-like domain-containing protein, partial [Tanacetum coccineum]
IESSLASIARSNWKTTLHPASRNGHHRVVEALLEKAPGILGRNYKGQIALRMVAKGETERSKKKEAQNEEREKRAVVAERRIAALQCSKMIKELFCLLMISRELACGYKARVHQLKYRWLKKAACVISYRLQNGCACVFLIQEINSGNMHQNVSSVSISNGTFEYKKLSKFHGNELFAMLRRRPFGKRKKKESKDHLAYGFTRSSRSPAIVLQDDRCKGMWRTAIKIKGGIQSLVRLLIEKEGVLDQVIRRENIMALMALPTAQSKITEVHDWKTRPTLLILRLYGGPVLFGGSKGYIFKPVTISEASIRSDLLFDDAAGIDSLPNQAIFDAIQLMGYTGDLTVLTFNKALFSPQWRPSPTTHIPDSIPEDSGRNQGGQSSSDRSLSRNEGGMTLQSVYNLCISLCTQSWIKSVSLKQRLARKKSLKKNWIQKESVSKQGRKSAKAEPSVHKDPLFDELDDDEIDNMDTEDAQDVWRTRNVVYEEKEGIKDAVSTEDVVSTDKEKVNTDRSKVSTDISKDSIDRPDEGTVDQTEGTVDQTEGRSATLTTPTTTPTMFGDDETIAQVLLNMSQAKAVSREKEKGVELKDVEETERPRPTSTRSLLTLKPLLKIDLKDKGKKKIEEEDESDTESEGIPEAEKKFKQLARDEEMARKVQEDWEAEEEVKKLAEEEAIKAALLNEYNFIQARMEADRLLALRLQDEERAVHSLYEKVKRFDESFTAVGFTEDERKIKEMNEGAKDIEQKKVAKETPKEEDTAKMLARKRKIPQSDVDSDDEYRKCLKIVTFEGTIDSEIMERKSVIARLNQEIVTWRLYEAFGVYILELEDGIVIHMLVERRYPLSNDLMQRMLDFGLEVEIESTVALDLIRFISNRL